MIGEVSKQVRGYFHSLQLLKEVFTLQIIIVIGSFILGYYFRRLVLLFKKKSKWFQKRKEQKDKELRMKKFAEKMKDLEIK